MHKVQTADSQRAVEVRDGDQNEILGLYEAEECLTATATILRERYIHTFVTAIFPCLMKVNNTFHLIKAVGDNVGVQDIDHWVHTDSS